MPGLVLTQNGAQAGNDNPEIRIRGIGTFGNNNPMVLIDGVEGSISQIAEIPSADIESISVLKDAASAAIYGVRAANGVILITTKRGQASSKVKVSYSGSYTLQTPGIVPDYVDGYNWALMKNEVSTGNFFTGSFAKVARRIQIRIIMQIPIGWMLYCVMLVCTSIICLYQEVMRIPVL